jgi:hypothetical protein
LRATVLAWALALAPAAVHAAEPPWGWDVGAAAGLFSGIGVRVARRFPERIAVGFTAGYLDLDPEERGGLRTRGASLGTEVVVDLSGGEVVRWLAVGGLGWLSAQDTDPDQDGQPDDYESLNLGFGVGMEVRAFRNLTLGLHALLGLDLVAAKPTASPEITLGYGF